jgi:hypothetical protein
MDQIIGLTRSNGPKIRSMALVWALNVSDAGAGRMFSIEDMVWDSQRTSVSATVGQTVGQSQGASRRVRTRGRGFGDDAIATPQKHFWARNEPYALRSHRNSLKSQQMRAPSERTINPRLALKLLTLITAPAPRA